jgi:formate dehydrogenase major subunit
MDDIKYSTPAQTLNQYDSEKDYGTPKKVSDTIITLNIDGVDISVPEGTSIMHAAQLSGVTVPKLCATDSLEPFVLADFV